MKKTIISLSVAAAAITLCSMSNNSMSNNAVSGIRSTRISPDSVAPATPAALPVMETYIPQDILTKLKSGEGSDSLYDITAVKTTDSTAACYYVLRAIKGGRMVTSEADSAGAPMTSNMAMTDTGTPNSATMKDTTSMKQ
jgi:hypothetical protein